MTLRIVKLVAENVKGLVAVEITPDEHFQIISGKNGQGKSTVLDTIWFALGGADSLKDTKRPIRNGADSASVTIDLGDMVVTRRWKGDSTTLDVRTKDGAKYPSPQSMLDKLIGRLSFDPFAFSTLKDSEQKKALLDMVELDINPDELDMQKKASFDDRTIVNREIKSLEAQLSALAVPSQDLPAEEVSAAEIMSRITAATAVKDANNLVRFKYQTVSDSYRDTKSDIERADKSIKELERQLEDKKVALKSLESSLATFVAEDNLLKAQIETLEEPDFEALTQELQSVEETNKKIRAAASYHQLKKSIAEKQAQAQEHTQKIADIELTKQTALKAAKFPIDGLGFDESGVTFGDIPFRQCSTGERLKVSMAMAMAMNPKLRVIRILDGSLLDKDNLKLIEQMAKDQDYQVWVEVVGTDGMGIVIESGEVKAMEAV